MGFLNRFTQPKAEIDLKITSVDLNENKITGCVSLSCTEAFKLDDVRLEAQVSEIHTQTNVGLTGIKVNQHRDVYLDQKFPLSGVIEGSAGYKGEFPFEIVIPVPVSKHGNKVDFKLKAVANIKGRPDITTKEIDPFHDAIIADTKNRQEKMKNYFKNVKPIS